MPILRIEHPVPDFDAWKAASAAMRAALTGMWRGVEAQGLIGSQRAQIIDTVETRKY